MESLLPVPALQPHQPIRTRRETSTPQCVPHLALPKNAGGATRGGQARQLPEAPWQSGPLLDDRHVPVTRSRRAGSAASELASADQWRAITRPCAHQQGLAPAGRGRMREHRFPSLGPWPPGETRRRLGAPRSGGWAAVAEARLCTRGERWGTRHMFQRGET